MLFEIYLRSLMVGKIISMFQLNRMDFGIFDNILEIDMKLDYNLGYSSGEIEKGVLEQILCYEEVLQIIFPYHVETTHITKSEHFEVKFLIMDNLFEELSEVIFKISTKKDLALLRLEDNISPDLLNVLKLLEEVSS